jgi:phosphatidylinositol glycan class S
MSASTKAEAASAPSPNDGVTGGGEDAPADAVNVAKAKKEPPPEKPEQIRMRSFVLLSFWAIIILLGLPIWWRTTTIYRANLPLDHMMDWAEGRVRFTPRFITMET